MVQHETPEAAHEHDQNHHHEDGCIAKTLKTTGGAAFAGLFVSALQNTLARHDHGARGVISRSGNTIAIFGISHIFIYLKKLAAVGGVFTATECLVESLRHEHPIGNTSPFRGEDADVIPSAVAGCAAGIIASARCLLFM